MVVITAYLTIFDLQLDIGQFAEMTTEKYYAMVETNFIYFLESIN